jgi:uncharacterized protein (DUF1778 family)
MRQPIVMNEDQKKEIKEAATACNLSISSFMKLAAKEKIDRMRQQNG